MPASRWQTAVALSAAIVVVVTLAIGIGWLTSLQSRSTRYAVSQTVSRVELTLSSGSAVIEGTQSSNIEIRRNDDYAFGHPATEQRSLSGGVLHIASRCPKIVVGSCSAAYELAVPETVTVSVRTTDGNVRLTGFRGNATVSTNQGNIDVDAYCGFDLAAATRSGNVRIAAACAPAHLEVRTAIGDAVALVPPGRYRIAAASGAGTVHVSGVQRDQRAPFTIEMHSGSGAITLGTGL